MSAMKSHSTPSPTGVLCASLLLPGSGHVWLGVPKRGLQFLFFIVVLIWAGNKALPEASYYVRHVGGLFVYGLCALDAFKIAKIAAVNAAHAKDRSDA